MCTCDPWGSIYIYTMILLVRTPKTAPNTDRSILLTRTPEMAPKTDPSIL